MYQKITIIGNLGADTEMRYTQSGKPVTNFSVATSRKYTTAAGETVEDTVWFRVSVWGKMAEACHEYLHKGSKVFVEGRMKPARVYESNGEHRASLEITAQVVKFLSPKSDQRSAEPQPPDEDEIPW